MKQLALLLMITVIVKTLPAQEPEADEINKTLELVIRNLPAGLPELKGTLVTKRGQTSRYQSKVTLPGATETVITEHVALGRKQISWKCVLFQHTDAGEVEKKYSEIYNRLNNSIIRSTSDKPFIVSGKYRAPAGKQTTVSRFQLLPSTGEMKHISIDVILEEQNSLFLLSINVHQ